MEKNQGKYDRIYSQFFDSTRTWPRDSRLLAVYLLAGPQRTLPGIYRLTIETAAGDLNWTPEETVETLNDLQERDFASYDHDARVVWIHKSLNYRKPGGNSQIVGAIRNLQALPRTVLWAGFVEACRRYAPDLASALDPVEGNGLDRTPEDRAEPDPDRRMVFPPITATKPPVPPQPVLETRPSPIPSRDTVGDTRDTVGDTVGDGIYSPIVSPTHSAGNKTGENAQTYPDQTLPQTLPQTPDTCIPTQSPTQSPRQSLRQTISQGPETQIGRAGDLGRGRGSDDFVKNEIQSQKRGGGDLGPDAFEDLWKSFPSRRPHPSSRTAAIREFRRLAGICDEAGVPVPTAAELVRAAGHYAAERAGQDPHFTLQLSTWLRDLHWPARLDGPMASGPAPSVPELPRRAGPEPGSPYANHPGNLRKLGISRGPSGPSVPEQVPIPIEDGVAIARRIAAQDRRARAAQRSEDASSGPDTPVSLAELMTDVFGPLDDGSGTANNIDADQGADIGVLNDRRTRPETGPDQEEHHDRR